MAITAQQKANLLGVTSFMFNFAPDQASYARFEARIEANPSFYALGTDLARTEAYTSQFAEGATRAEKIDLILGRLGLTEGEGYERGVNFINQRLDAGIPEGQVLMEIGEKLLQETPPAGLEDAAAILRNKIDASEAYLESGIEGYSSETLPDLLANITADAASVEEARAAIDAVANEGDTSDLTEALNTLASAEAGVAASLAAAAEAVNAAEGDNALEGDALKTFVENFDEGDLEAAITAAEGDVATAEANVNTAQATLLNARASTFDGEALLDAVTDANDADAALDSNGDAVDVNIDLGLTAANRQTDANIAKAVAEAQKAVNADKVQYVADGSLATDADLDDANVDTFTAKALQTAAINAESALNADVSAKGSNADLLAELRTAIADLANAGVDVTDAGTYDANAVTTADAGALTDVLAEVNTLLTALDDAADATATADAETDIAEFVAVFFDAAANDGAGDGVLADLNTGNADLDKAFNNLVADFEQRAELAGKSAAADEAFNGTLTGAVLKAAQDLQEERDGLKDDVTSADQELTKAQDLLSDLETLQKDYDAAVTDLEAAQQYFTDNDLELPVSIEGGVTATAENDIFLYTEKAGTVSGFGLEGEDQLFVGTGFTWTALEAGDDLATDRLGDSGVLEIFAQQSGNNVVLSFENETFAGSAENTDDITVVTLTGVSLENLNLSADGFITVA